LRGWHSMRPGRSWIVATGRGRTAPPGSSALRANAWRRWRRASPGRVPPWGATAGVWPPPARSGPRACPRRASRAWRVTQRRQAPRLGPGPGGAAASWRGRGRPGCRPGGGGGRLAPCRGAAGAIARGLPCRLPWPRPAWAQRRRVRRGGVMRPFGPGPSRVHLPPSLVLTGRSEALAPGHPLPRSRHSSSAAWPGRALPRHAWRCAAAAGGRRVLGERSAPRASRGRRRRRVATTAGRKGR